MKMYSTSLIIMEMHDKTTMRYHITPFIMTIMTKTRNEKCWGVSMEKGTLVHYCGGNVSGTGPTQNSTEFVFLISKIKDRATI